MASSMVSWWYSDQFILLAAPRAAMWWVPFRASVSDR